MSFESITEIWTYFNEMSFESIQRDVVWEHYRNLNLLHSTRCRLRALQKSELIALNEMSFESITEIWTYCTQRDVVWERNLQKSATEILLHSTRCRLRALQKSERIALNEMSFESITEIWTYCTQRGVFWELQKSERISLNDMTFESITEIWTYCTQRDVVREHYRNLLLHSTRYLQKS